MIPSSTFHLPPSTLHQARAAFPLQLGADTLPRLSEPSRSLHITSQEPEGGWPCRPRRHPSQHTPSQQSALPNLLPNTSLGPPSSTPMLSWLGPELPGLTACPPHQRQQVPTGVCHNLSDNWPGRWSGGACVVCGNRPPCHLSQGRVALKEGTPSESEDSRDSGTAGFQTTCAFLFCAQQPLPGCGSAFLGAGLHSLLSPATSVLPVGHGLHTQPCSLSRERRLAKSPPPRLHHPVFPHSSTA